MFVGVRSGLYGPFVGQLSGEVVVAPPARVHEELAVVVGQGHLS